LNNDAGAFCAEPDAIGVGSDFSQPMTEGKCAQWNGQVQSLAQQEPARLVEVGNAGIDLAGSDPEGLIGHGQLFCSPH